jgi:threonine dehydrogenase-like Zn-dependent dehydrogenase
MLDAAIFAAPTGSRVVVAGVCMEPDTIRPLIAIVKELDLRFVYAYSQDEFAETLRAIAEGELDVAPLVSGAVGLDGVAEAFDALRAADHHVKVLVEPDGSTEIEEVRLERA